MLDLIAITEAITAQGIPIDGIAADGRIDFQPQATEAQRALAQNILDNWTEPTRDEQTQSQLLAAIASNRLARLLLASEDISEYTTEQVIDTISQLMRYVLRDEKFNWTLEARS